MRTRTFYLMLLFCIFSICGKAQGFYFKALEKQKILLIGEGLDEYNIEVDLQDKSVDFGSNLFPGLWAQLDADDKKLLGIDKVRKEEDLLVLMRAGVSMLYEPDYHWGSSRDDDASVASRQKLIDEYIAKQYVVYVVPSPGSFINRPITPGKYPFLRPGMLSGKVKPTPTVTPVVAATTRTTLVPYLTKAYDYIYVDSATMKPISNERYDEAAPFQNGLARIKKDGLYGYIDNTGKMIIPPTFRKAFHFAGGVAIVGTKSLLAMEEKYGLINKKGAYVLPLEYYWISAAGVARYKAAKDYPYMGTPVYYYVRTNGEKLFDIPFNEAGTFTNGLAPVKKIDAKYYIYMDYQGNEFINTGAAYTEANSFSGGRGAVKLDGKWGFINNKGEMVIENIYDRVQNFQEDVAAVKKGNKWIYIDVNGKQVINQEFDLADYFRQGLAVVKLNNRYGYIDKTGQVVLPIQYVAAVGFTDGLAQVYDEKAKAYQVINRSGKVVYSSPKQFLMSAFFDTGLFDIISAGFSFFIDKSGRMYKEGN